MTRHSASFDLLRLIAALMVVFSHQFPLNGYQEPHIPFYGTFGGLGVIIFFALSGYLNCQSVFRSRSASTFLFNRALRISPGVFICSIFCIVLGAFVTTSSMTEYFTSTMGNSLPLPATVVFLIKNTFPIHRIGTDLPGVFADNHFKTIVNGSLWTLPYEAKSYLLLALGAVIVRFNQSTAIRAYAVIFCCLALSGFFFSVDALLEKERLLKFLVLFSTGAFIALVENRFGSRIAIAVSILIPLSFAASSNFSVAFVTGITCPVVLIGMIRSLPKIITPKIDISYGVYIYSFPIQQTLSRFELNWYTNFAIVLAATITLGVLSAVLVERPALRLRRSSSPRDASRPAISDIPTPAMQAEAR